jgi:alpha-beta hydrolase superfamily lysophospholipase
MAEKRRKTLGNRTPAGRPHLADVMVGRETGKCSQCRLFELGRPALRHRRLLGCFGTRTPLGTAPDGDEPMKNSPIARRTLLRQASLGLGIGLGTGIGTGVVSGVTPAAAQTAASETGDAAGTIWGHQYWARKGDVKLALYRKRTGQPVPGGKPFPVLFLVHGSSLSALSSYDLDVPGSEYSMIKEFADAGFDVWTMDHEGYGRSTDREQFGYRQRRRGPENCDGGGAARDRPKQSSHVRRIVGCNPRRRVRPERAGSGRPLILAAFTYKGSGAAEIERRKRRIAELRANPRRKRDAAMSRSIFSRDGHPSLYDPAMVEALVASEIKYGDTVPSGTYLDMAANLPLVDPAKVTSPVLMTRGEWDGNSTNDDLLDFFRQLPSGDRQFVIVPNTAHSQAFSKNRQLLWYAMRNFLGEPSPVAS